MIHFIQYYYFDPHYVLYPDKYLQLKQEITVKRNANERTKLIY